MATIRPFKAVRPRKDLASRIAALPYDVYSTREAREVVKKEPYSFLKIDRAETQLPEGVDLYSPEVYEKAGSTLKDMIADGEFIQDETPCFYLYELTMNGRSQTGLGCCVKVSEYEQGIIKKHENTRVDKEEDRTRHIKECHAQTGPVFLAYRYNKAAETVIDNIKKSRPEYDFVSVDGISHRLWVISDPVILDELTDIFRKTDRLYIADGHHRAASAVRVAKERRLSMGEIQDGESEYFLAVLFPDSELMIMDYNRCVKDLNGLTVDEFMQKMQEKFHIKKQKDAFHPAEKGQYGMYIDGSWYSLSERAHEMQRNVIEELDVSVLQNEVLCPILGIEEPRTDKRISFIGGIRGLGELERLVDDQGGVAFAMYPTSMKELFSVADENLLMPPKSTWFEPKLRSGLLIHQI